MRSSSARRRAGTLSVLRPDLRPGSVYLCPHALDQLRCRYPSMDVEGGLSLLQESREMEPEWVAVMTARSTSGVRDRYFLTPDGLGLFVVAPNRNTESRFPSVVVTWLRFGPSQRHYALQLLGAA